MKTFRKSLAARIRANRFRPHNKRKNRLPIYAIERLEDRTLLSAAGDIEWLRQFGSVTPDFKTDLAHAVDAGGNVYAAGSTGGTLPGQTSAGGEDAFVRKYDSNGTELWTRQFGSSSFDQMGGISVDSGGNVYVAGYTRGTLPGQTSAGGFDAFVRKYDSNGTELWTRQLGSSFYDAVYGISVDASGVYVVGETGGSLLGQTSAGLSDAFVRKYDLNGTEVWTRQFGTSSRDIASGISVDASGVYVVGDTGGSLPGETSSGNLDTFVRKYDSNGTEIWTRQFGTSSNEFAYGISVNTSGIYVAGETRGSLLGQTSAGGRDAFVRKYDSNGTEVWTRQFGTSSRDVAFGISVDASGVYVAGEIGFASSLPGQTSVGSVDAFVRKYDSNGTELWTRQFGTSSYDAVIGISVDASGVYLAGQTFGTLPGQTSAGNDDAFVRKYDTSGTKLWTRQFGSVVPAFKSDFAQAADSNGNVYVAGRTSGTLPGQTNAGGEDAFVRKYDSNGTEVWTRQFGTSSNDRAVGIFVDASGVYVAGQAGDSLPGQTSAGNFDAFVRKYDSNGTEVWTRQFGSSSDDLARGISVDASGVYVVGRTFGSLPGQTSAGDRDAFVRKYDSNGTEVWTRQFGTSSRDIARGISVDTSGVYVAGETRGSFSGQTSAGGRDAFVRKYDSNGTEVWTRQFGSSSNDRAFGISVDVSGAVYVSGVTSGSFTSVDAVTGTNPDGLLTSAGNEDAFVRKYNVNGTEVWTRQFGTSSNDRALGISVDTSGVYVAGQTRGSFLGQTNAGLDDAFVRKYASNGTEVWTRQFGTSSGDIAFGISVDASGVYVVGRTTGTFPGQTSLGGADAFVAKLSINAAPIANAGQKETVLERTLVTLNGSLSGDVDGDLLTFAWVQTDGPTTVTLSDRSAAITEFTAPVVLSRNTTFKFKLTVTDPSDASDSDTVIITVNPDLGVLAKDSDVDGITDRVDTQPNKISDAFGDNNLYGDGLVGGTTFGTITLRGDRKFKIFDKVPGGITVNVSIGDEPAQLTACSAPEIIINISKGLTHKGNLDCGSATVEVLEGEAVVSTLTNGTTVSVTVDAGDIVTFDETPTGELTVVQSGTGQTTQIETTIGGQTFIAQLDLGESVTYTISALGSVTAAAAGGEIVLEIDGGSPIALPAGGTLATVGIDIKPGSFPNSINLGSHGTIPVAIFSTPDFDATTIDPSTVTLADAQVRVRGKGTPMASTQDVNDDGLLDLVVHVETEGLALSPADIVAQLVGETFGGVAIVGSDAIRVVAALHVADGPAEGVIVGDGLTHATLNSVVEESLAYWTAAGVEPHRLDALTQLDVQIADLPDSLLGIAALNIVWIDQDAAGYGWSVNSGGVDLFSAVTHEFGHVLGFRHDEMGATLGVGVRQLAVEEHDHESEWILTPLFDSNTQNDSTSDDNIETEVITSPQQLAEKFDYAMESNIEIPLTDEDSLSSEPVPYLPEEDLDSDSFFSEFEESLMDDLLAIS